MPRMHPATRLVVWAALVVSTQLARGPILWSFGFVVMGAAFLFARHRARRLVRRIRLLLLMLLVLFAFFTPGEALLPALGSASPTLEGAALAALHCSQLLIVVLLVALLLELTDEKALVAGLMVLARPFALLGVPVERMAVRLLLVFRYVESPPPGGWRGLLAPAVEAPGEDSLRIVSAPLRWWDRLAIAGVLLLALWGTLG